MEPENIDKLAEGMKAYQETHDPRKFRANDYLCLRAGEDADPRLSDLISKDKYGEYLGKGYHGIVMASDGFPKTEIRFYFDEKFRPVAMRHNLGMGVLQYEMFEYYEDYYVGQQYSYMSKKLMPFHFTYYFPQDGRVTELRTIYSAGMLMDWSRILVQKISLSYENGETKLVSALNCFYALTGGSYVLDKEIDMLAPEPKPKRRRIDNQQKLCEKMKSMIRPDMRLIEAAEVFFTVVKTAKKNPDAILYYVAGRSHFQDSGKMLFTLSRQTLTKDGEFYNLDMQISFDIADDVDVPHFSKPSDDPDKLYNLMLASEAFGVLRKYPITDISVTVEET